jgi:LysW-gamma-L-lysine carboxypeptidase
VTTAVGDLLHAMVAIPSPSGAEHDLAVLVRDSMADLGFRARIDEAGNVIGEIGEQQGPRILLLGHLDTVPGQLPVVRSRGEIHGRGAVDAKGPLATMIAAAARAHPAAQLMVAGAVEEEVASSAGARHLLRTLETPDAIIIGEPTGWSGVGIGYRGCVRLDVTAHRPATHSSSPESKAVEVVAELWYELRGYLRDQHPGGGLFDSATGTLLSLHGDGEFAQAAIACRVPAGFDFEAMDKYVDSMRERAEIRVNERVPAVERDRTDPVVRALTAAIRAAGARPTLKQKSGTSDMNVVNGSWPVPMAAYGPGDSKLDHTDREHVEEAELERAVDVLAATIEQLGRTLGPAAHG